MSRNSLFEASQAIISVELLITLQWLMNHEEPLVRELLQNALDNGLREKITTAQENDAPVTNDLLENITLFFEQFEELLADLLIQEPRQQTLAGKTPKVLNKVVESIFDENAYDQKIINQSIEKTNKALKKNKALNAKRLFFREFLKNWNPTKKNHIQ